MTAAAHLNRHEKQMEAMDARVREGRKIVAGRRSGLRALAQDLRALAAAQVRMQANVDKLMPALLRTSNGLMERKVNLP